MDTAHVNGATFEFEVQGRGEPLLLIHGAIIADAWAPILDPLAERFQVITYHRRGFRGSSPHRDDNTIAAEATDAVALLDHVGVGPAHVAGHSYGGAVALQLAHDAPSRVHSMALLEPGLLCVASAGEFGAGVEEIAEIFGSGDRDATLEAFLTAVGGDNPIERLDASLGGKWHEHALEDLPTLFAGDLAALQSWQFSDEQARSITQPALVVLGTETFPLCAESYELLRQAMPAAEPFEVAGATHMLHMDDPDQMSKGLIEFFTAHPIDG